MDYKFVWFRKHLWFHKFWYECAQRWLEERNTLEAQLKDAEKRVENMMQVWRDYRYCGQEWSEDCPLKCELRSVCSFMDEAYRSKYGGDE